MMSNSMADLEKLAVQRDRGYLVRLVLGLAVAGVLSVFIFRGLTGQETSGCMANAFLGGDAERAPSAQ
jgi:hypothetical protein